MMNFCPNRTHAGIGDLVPMTQKQDGYGEYWECPICHYQEDIEPECATDTERALKAQIATLEAENAALRQQLAEARAAAEHVRGMLEATQKMNFPTVLESFPNMIFEDAIGKELPTVETPDWMRNAPK